MNDVSQFRNVSAKAAQEQAIRSGQNKQKAQPSILRLFALLTTSDSEYTFNFDHDAQQNISPLARGLQFRNGFQAIAMAIGIMPVKTASSVLYWGANPAIWYPDANLFTTAASGVLSEAEALEGLYNGDFSLQTNEGLRIDRHPTNIFRTVPATQTASIIHYTGATAIPQKNSDFGDQYKSLGGVYNVQGGDDNYIKIRLQTKDKAVITGSATRTNYIVIDVLGTEVKGNTTSQLQK